MIGVVADDTTGANDIGVMFAKHGWTTAVVAHDAPDPLPTVDALVLDTDSRLDAPAVAGRKVGAATRRLQALGCTWLHKKTCSVFRGNIGAECDAMLEACGANAAIVSVAFPKNGRATQHGVHTVHGVRLEDSAFARDPVHPMRESNLLAVLGAQTNRPVRLVALEVVRSGPAALRAALHDAVRRGGYVVVDAVSQRDLATLAEAAWDFPVFAGSSAIAEELPPHWARPAPRDVLAGRTFDDDCGVLIVAGSLTPQTRAQTEALAKAGVPSLQLDARLVFTAETRTAERLRVSRQAVAELRAGRDALVLASQEAAIVAETKARGAALGLDPLAASRAVSAALADIVADIVDETGLTRLVVAGGDTSGAVCRRLGIRGNFVLEEVAPGVPSGLALGRPMVLVLKSGSFGDAEFLLTARDHLKALTARRKVTL